MNQAQWSQALRESLQKPSVFDSMFAAPPTTRSQRIRLCIGGWIHAVADLIDRRGYWERY